MFGIFVYIHRFFAKSLALARSISGLFATNTLQAHVNSRYMPKVLEVRNFKHNPSINKDHYHISLFSAFVFS